MIEIRKSYDRGSTKTPWLNSQHTFNFGSYYDPNFRDFGILRVINEDKVLPDSGFLPHSHHDMEIISYVLAGSLEHKDSLGTGSIIRPGEVQLMSAGSGITHSEFNPSKNTPIHFLQIWIIPERKGLTPSYQQKNFQEIRKVNPLTLLVSHEGEGGSLIIHQDVKVYVLDLVKGQSFPYTFDPDRMVWIQVARGEVSLNSNMLHQGDGVAVTHEKGLNFTAQEDAEILIFDLVRIS